MSDARETRDQQLLARLLGAVDDAAESNATNHPDEETIALFAAGALRDAERRDLIAHLDACASCRQLASQVLAAAEDTMTQASNAPMAAPSRPAEASRPRWMMWAVAASLLIVTGTLLYSSRRESVAENRTYRDVAQRLSKSEFDAAEKLVADAAQRGVQSERLQSLKAQAIRKMPQTVALASAGRLSDFGYDIGGVVARDPAADAAQRERTAEAEQILAPLTDRTVEVLLNRGHVLLSQGHPDQALKDFQLATQKAPDNAWGWLGLGLAQFLLDDFAAADQAFANAERLDPQNLAVAINRAMTHEELGNTAQARKEWQELLRESLTAAERAKIELHLNQLPGAER